jgi:pimeloyl-ACP methyl ester carboxylesterase
MTTDLNVRAVGEGEPIVFIHGGFGGCQRAFDEQRELADQFRLLFVDRKGYGDSPPAERLDFDSQAADIAEVLDDGAHLVGHSYGGLLSLLAAARRPDAVRSLTVIEPPALSVARGDPAVEVFVSRLGRWYADSKDTPAERLRPHFLAAFGFERPTAVNLGDKDRVAAITTTQEPPPFEAQVPVDLLAAAPFPKLVVSGEWDTAPPAAREIAGRALQVVGDVLEQRLGAEQTRFAGAAHNPQLLGKPFNDRLRAFLCGVTGDG